MMRMRLSTKKGKKSSIDSFCLFYLEAKGNKRYELKKARSGFVSFFIFC